MFRATVPQSDSAFRRSFVSSMLRVVIRRSAEFRNARSHSAPASIDPLSIRGLRCIDRADLHQVRHSRALDPRRLASPDRAGRDRRPRSWRCRATPSPAMPSRPQLRRSTCSAHGGTSGRARGKPWFLHHRSGGQPQRHHGSLFRRFELNLGDLATLRNLPELRSQVDRLKPGELLRFMHRDGELVGLERKLSDSETLKVTRDANGFISDVLENPLEVRTRTASATIQNSLFQAAADARALRSRRVRSRRNFPVRHRLRARHPVGRSLHRRLRRSVPGRRAAAHRQHPRREIRQRRPRISRRALRR